MESVTHIITNTTVINSGTLYLFYAANVYESEDVKRYIELIKKQQVRQIDANQVPM